MALAELAETFPAVPLHGRALDACCCIIPLAALCIAIAVQSLDQRSRSESFL